MFACVTPADDAGAGDVTERSKRNMLMSTCKRPVIDMLREEEGLYFHHELESGCEEAVERLEQLIFDGDNFF